jgi:hypothetical protein
VHVRQIAAARLVVRVAHIIAGLNAFTGDVTTSGHNILPQSLFDGPESDRLNKTRFRKALAPEEAAF